MALLEDLTDRTFNVGDPFELPDEKATTLPPEAISDKEALKIVVQDAIYTEHWLAGKMLPMEWLRCERLYQFKVPLQFWEGTSIPRANLGMPLVYEHVESILPQVIGGLFADNPPFMSRPRPGTSMNAARANDALLTWELNRAHFREGIRSMCKSALIFGTGIGKWGWHSYTRKVKQLQRKNPGQFVPAGVQGGITLYGNDEVEPVEKTIEVNEPTFEFVNLTHVLVDPSCRTSDIRGAKFIIHRIYLTLLDLKDLADNPDYKLPPIELMKQLFFPPKEPVPIGSLETSTADMTTEFKAMPRNQDSTIDPTQQPLEVLEYWTQDRVYTVVNRRLVIRNQANPLHKLPFVSICFSDIIDSFYGMGVGRLVGGEQRMQQGVMNSFLDDLSLSLNGMFVRVRGKNTFTGQLRMRPGGVIDTDDEKGIGMLQRQPIQLEVGPILAESDRRAERRTAASEFAVQGTMPSQGRSITRTATGVQALTGGSGARLQYFIENAAYQAFVPILEAFHAMNQQNLKPSQVKNILTKELEVAYNGDVLDLLNADVDFDILAASRLQARMAYRASLPLIYQFLLTEPVIQGLQIEGKKVNISELVNMLFQVTGWPNEQNVVVDMSPEDQQRLMMQNPAVQQLMTQRAQSAQQTGDKSQLLTEETEQQAGRDVIRALLKQMEGPTVGAKVNNGK